MWNKISIRKFLALEKAKEQPNEVERIVHAVKAIEGLTDKQVNELPLKDFKDLYKGYTWLEEQPNKLIVKFKLNGRKFKICYRTDMITGGQLIDVMHILKGCNQNPKEINKNLDNIMAVICEEKRSLKSVLKGKLSHEQKIQLFYEELPATIFIPLSAFFLRTWEKYLEIIPTYLMEVAQELQVNT